MMNTKAIAVLVVGIVVVVSVAVVVFGTNVFTDPWWETETVFGVWQDELVIEYADGTTDTLRLIQEKIGKPLEYYHSGKEVTSCYLLLKAEITETGDSGYDSADLICNNFGYQRTAWTATGTKVYTGPDAYTGKEYRVPIGNTQTIISKENSGCTFATMLANQPDGAYLINWDVKGSVEYRGYPGGGDWETATNPPDRALAVVKDTTSTGQIVVTLTSEAGTE